MALVDRHGKRVGLVQKRDRKGNVAWYARIVRTLPDGTKKQYTRKGDDKSHAKRLLKDLENQFAERRHEGIQGERMTFRDLASVYSERHITPAQYSDGPDGRKITGLKNTVNPRRFLQTVVQHLGSIRLRDLTHSDIEHFQIERLKTPVIHERIIRTKHPESGEITCETIRTERHRKISGVNRELEQIRAALRFAVRQGWLLRSPFDTGRSLISKAAEYRRERTLSYDEESRLLIVCAKKPGHLKPIVVCALDTAMRKSEMLKLCWQDVDFESGIIRVKASNSKTERPRTLPMTDRLRDELNRLTNRPFPNSNDLVFGVRDNVKRSFSSACQEANIENFRLHDCRHTAVTRMIAAGIAAEEVMKISGHSQITTFLRYLNPTNQTLGRAAKKLTDYNLENQPAEVVSTAVN